MTSRHSTKIHLPPVRIGGGGEIFQGRQEPRITADPTCLVLTARALLSQKMQRESRESDNHAEQSHTHATGFFRVSRRNIIPREELIPPGRAGARKRAIRYRARQTKRRGTDKWASRRVLDIF